MAGYKPFEIIGRLEADDDNTFRVLAKAAGEGRQIPLWGKISNVPQQENVKGGTTWNFKLKDDEILIAEAIESPQTPSSPSTTTPVQPVQSV